MMELHICPISAKMHSMSEGAISDRRARRMQETAFRLTHICRRLTAQRGLAGFTIEEVCDEVGVSRRTFFNYFPSKEDAVIGVDPEHESQLFGEEFLARGATEWANVMDDLVELVIAHFEANGSHSAGHGEFMQALEREPRLFARFVGISRERERQATAMIAQRQGVAVDDPRAVAAVGILTTLLRSAGERLLDSDDSRDFSSILTESLAAFRAVLTAPSPRKATQ